MTGFNKIFFDTNPIIYHLDENEEFCTQVDNFMIDNAIVPFVTSTVTVVEYLTGIYRHENEEKEADFDSMITEYGFEVIPISYAVAREAARIRGKYKSFKAMDSIQLAVAKLTGCDVFLSNDKRLCQYSDVKVLLVEDL